MSNKIQEDDKNYLDKRIINKDVLKNLDKDMLGPTKDKKRGERKGDPNQEEPYIPHSPGN